MQVRTPKDKNKIPTVSKPKFGTFESGDITFTEKMVGDLWVREIEFLKAGSKKEGHKHNFDHLHFVVAGSVELFQLSEEDGKVTETSLGIKKAPAMLTVKKGIAHSIIALEDNTSAYCIQTARFCNGEDMETEYCDDTHKDVRL